MSSNETPVGFKPKKSVALSGQVAGNTALCTVGRSGNDLHYRGYDILDLAVGSEFEEVAHLLVHGKLPNKAELKAYKAKLKALRGLPAALKKINAPLNVFHQCGQNQQDVTLERYQDAPATLKVDVQPFIHDMAKAYSEADLIICRAGALTVTEVATAGVAAVFVPLPIAVDDHQTANAKFLANVGAAKICQQAEMTPDVLDKLLSSLINRQLLSEMAVKARQQAQPNATQHVVDLIKKL